MRLNVVLGVVLALAPYLTISAGDKGSLSISTSADNLRVRGVTPGGRVALLGVSSRTDQFISSSESSAQIIMDEDRDGTVTYAPKKGIPFRSVWVAVDITAGSHAVATPPGHHVDHFEVPHHALRRNADGLSTVLELQQGRAEFLLVRPGEGAWKLSAYEGGGGDIDRVVDGRLTISVENAKPLGADQKKPPKNLKAGDVLAAIDPRHFEVRTLTVEP